MGPHDRSGGDLARRIAQRRTELGLTRREVAERAGMAPGYVDYLEEHSARFTRESLYRLSQALRTSPEHLLGAEAGHPPGGAASAARDPRTWELTVQECLALIAPGGVGRVAFVEEPGPMVAVVPVNYAPDDGTAVFRTVADGVIARHTPGPMSIEVDRIDAAMGEGWSVVLAGYARRVEDARECSALQERTALRPWAGGARDTWVRIVPGRVTGRRVGDAGGGGDGGDARADGPGGP